MTTRPAKGKRRNKKRIGYILSTAFYSTFEMREILALRQLGFEVYVFSLKPPADPRLIAGSESLLPNLRYTPFLLSAGLLKAQPSSILESPAGYAGALQRLFRKNFRQPATLLKSCAVFPKSVHYARLVRQLGIEHIHAHFASIPTTAAMIIADLTGVPFSCTAHNSDLFEYPPPDLGDRVARAAPFITISEFNRRHLLHRFPYLREDAIKIVHCGIDMSVFRPAPRGARNGGPTELLTVARLVKMKALPVLIEACARLKQNGHRFSLNILGDGPERPTIEGLIAQHGLESEVHLRGGVAAEDTVAYYQAADIFVLPSYREGIPVSAMEAMAMELPVVTTNVYGIPELVDNEKTGLLVSPGDPVALAEAIEKLIASPSMGRKMGQLGREKVEREFNIKTSARQLQEYLTS